MYTLPELSNILLHACGWEPTRRPADVVTVPTTAPKSLSGYVHKQRYRPPVVTQQLTQLTAEYFVSPKARHGGFHALAVRENEVVPPTESAMAALTAGGLEPAGEEQN